MAINILLNQPKTLRNRHSGNSLKACKSAIIWLDNCPLPATNPRNILIFNLLWGYFYTRNITFSKTIRPGRAYELAVNVFAER
jgi:hypothetical protein